MARGLREHTHGTGAMSESLASVPHWVWVPVPGAEDTGLLFPLTNGENPSCSFSVEGLSVLLVEEPSPTPPPPARAQLQPGQSSAGNPGA